MLIEYDSELVQNIEKWTMIVQSAKIHQGLQCGKEEKNTML